jgi:predicted nucleic acid-binding protein
MKTWVIDARVIIKWFITNAENESDIDMALKLLMALQKDKKKILQPFHWLAEVAAVMTRLRPEHAENVISLLYAMELPTCNDPIMLNIACRLGKKYQHHLFDTLYHAVALYQDNATLVTADVVYFNKTYQEGKIILLSNLEL